MLIDVGQRRLRAILFGSVLALVAVHVGMLAGGLPMPQEGTGLRARFNLDAEGNIPSKYATLQLLLCIGLLLLLFVEARGSGRAWAWHWLALAAVFVFLTLDEYYSIHERLNRPMKRLLGPGNALEFAWVIPYAALLVAFTATFLGFWKHLPVATRRGLMLAAVIYVGGAMGMETLGSFVVINLGWESPLYALEVVLEEGMELAGIALFILVLASLLGERAGHVTLQLDTGSIERHQELLQDIAHADRRNGEGRSAAG